MKGKDPALKYCQTWRCPSTVSLFTLLVCCTCSWDTLATVVAEHWLENTYFHQSFCNFAISNVVVRIHTKYYVMSIVLKLTQKFAQIANEESMYIRNLNVLVFFEVTFLLAPRCIQCFGVLARAIY